MPKTLNIVARTLTPLAAVFALAACKQGPGHYDPYDLTTTLIVAPPASSTLGELHSPDVIDVVAFGSCARESQPQPLWADVVATDPDLFLFIGDNMYADVPEIPERASQIADTYDTLAAIEGYQNIKATCPVLATWDDHDYGLNDAGKEWHLRDPSQELLIDFFYTPEQGRIWRDEARKGVYHSATFGPVGQRLQVILLDTRYHRDPLDRHDSRPQGRGPYKPTTDTARTMLGDAQWDWLTEELQKPADLRIIASSIQIIAYEHGWETWGNLPHERERLYSLIERTGAEGVVFVSGDRHLIEISNDTESGPYPMWDFTSSGINQKPGNPVGDPNRFRVGPVLRQQNFGLIRIDWDDRGDNGIPSFTLEGRTLGGDQLLSVDVDGDTLSIR